MPTEHLLGENLGEKNKKTWESVRAVDTIMNTSLATKRVHKTNDYNYRLSAMYRRSRGFRFTWHVHMRRPLQAWGPVTHTITNWLNTVLSLTSTIQEGHKAEQPFAPTGVFPGRFIRTGE